MTNQTYSINQGLVRAPVKGSALAAFKVVRSLASLLHACRGRELSLHSGHGVKTRTNTHSKQPNTHASQGNGAMASASVVGQHPGPHRLFKLTGGTKKISVPTRKLSWEKMMPRRSSGSGGGSVSANTEGEPGTHPLSPGPAGETAVRRGMMPGEGCGAPAAPAAPRSADRDREQGRTDSDRRTAAGTQSESGRITSDCNCNIDCDSNHNTGGRRGTSFKRSGINVMPSGSVMNGHKGGHRHRDATHGRRDTRSRDSGHQSITSSSSSLPAQGESGGLLLERLTQGKTGVVRLARTEPHRREAWSIFPRGMDPRVRTERGEGHRFEAKPVKQDWCDACSRQITAQALKCQSK